MQYGQERGEQEGQRTVDQEHTTGDQERAAGDEEQAAEAAVPGTATPGDALRALPAEAADRGTRFVSAQAMQARLFSVYDAAAAAEDALTLVQNQLTLTLNRSYYEADEIEQMAQQLDGLLALGTVDLGRDELVSDE